jgi:uncharacterized membrane protein YgcG
MANSRRTDRGHIAVEALERRCLFSASLTGAFGGRFPSSLQPGGKNSVTVRILNTGDATTNGSAAVALYASTDPTLDAGDTLLATKARAGHLKSGAGANLPIRFASPTTLPDGSYYLLGKITTNDPASAAAPSLFASAAPVIIDQPSMDLVTEFTAVPARPIQTNGIISSERRATVRLVNIGNVPANGTVQVNLYMSDGPVLDNSSTLAGGVARLRVRLAPGRSRAASARLILPSGTTPGNYRLFAVMTPQKQIVERRAADAVAASADQVDVTSNVPDDVLAANFRRRRRDCIYYDGGDYAADTAATYGASDLVVAGPSVPPGFTPPAPTSNPSTAPTSQPSTEPWDAGLPQAQADVAAEQSAAAADGSGDSGDDSGGSGDSGDGGSDDDDDGDFGDSGGDDGGGDGGDDD